MSKFVYTILYLLKRLVFEDRNAYDFSSKEFNVRQILTFFLMVFLVIVNIALAKRTAVLSDALDKQKTKIELCMAKHP